MSHAVMVALALLLDAILGEPKWLWSRLPHPAVLMGRLIARAEQRLNNRTRGAGVLLVFAIVVAGGFVGWITTLLGPVAETIVIAILLAQKSLVEHIAIVARDLRLSLPSARTSVAMIVSRDTTDMNEPETARAAIESGAENLSDGVIAPAFWALIGGAPGIILYKMINTADSMVGYRTERYDAFGWAAAKLDDVVNWIPARLTAALLWVVGGCRASWADIRQEAQRHKSPNAGWPEAVLARNIRVALAGPRTYHGTKQDLPWVNPTGDKSITANSIDAAIRQLWLAWALALLFTIGIALVF